MVQHHKYSLSDIEGLIPYERDLYVGMLLSYLEDQRAEIESRP